MTRSALPQRRPQETFDLDHGGQRYSVSVGHGSDGAPGEVFVTARKPGSDVEAAARDAGISISLAIQHGVPLSLLQAAVTRDGRGQPASVVGAVLDAMGDTPTP